MYREGHTQKVMFISFVCMRLKGKDSHTPTLITQAQPPCSTTWELNLEPPHLEAVVLPAC